MVLTYNRVNSNKETFNIESKNNNLHQSAALLEDPSSACCSVGMPAGWGGAVS